ncbi:MFS transporter [Nocardioides sp. GY 10127]|uniref:MFS transporter n=1 Tax=Nocardioides sp. GY 10127 TaxID=2569762 RepID=UPI0010A7979F|nr:MFS transporter [Nocardioides sp. GY 10127]TIC80786.1 MFS transporter [Nocardioides sp. GY 10127]
MTLPRTARTTPADRPTSLLSSAYRSATVGALTLVALAAFESLAVATVMPVVTADLDGRSLYAVAFSATLAAGVVGMVAAGAAADRWGLARPALTAISLFGLGLVVAGLAPSMEVLVVGRFLQGLGAGSISVCLYVLVGLAYAPVDRPRILGAFAGAWVLPGIVGPFVAGVVADTVGWRWVFLGVLLLEVPAAAFLVPTLRRVAREHGANPQPDAAARADEEAGPALPTGGVGTSRPGVRLLLAVGVAAAVVLLNLASSLAYLPRAAVALGAVALALVALRPLLPDGTLRGAPGIPAIIAYRAAVAGAYFTAEAYLPFLLQARYDAPPWLAGLVLTVACVSWASGAWLQGHGPRVEDRAALLLGGGLALVGVLVELGVALVEPHAAWAGTFVGVGWLATAGGLGFAYPRITSAVLDRTPRAHHGTASSAVTIADSVGAAVCVAIGGLVFTTLGTSDSRWPFVGVMALAAAVAGLSVVLARRT